MEDDIKAFQKQMILCERLATRLVKAQVKMHCMGEQMVARYGSDAGLSPEVVANITGPKVPPNDD